MQLERFAELSEEQFAECVDAMARGDEGGDRLVELLQEEHPVYHDRAASAIVRMRGWLLHSLSLNRIPNSAILFIIEELETGTDAYLIAAAAKALRSIRNPTAALAPFVLRSIQNIRFHDAPVTFETYGAFAMGVNTKGALNELFATVEWLGSNAASIAPDLRQIVTESRSWSNSLMEQANATLALIERQAKPSARLEHDCCDLPISFRNFIAWATPFRKSCDQIKDVLLEDQAGRVLSFSEMTQAKPTIVVFFYTRCENPLKCSLTIGKLAQIQRLLVEQDLSNRIRTLAITYDPGYDTPARLKQYCMDRNLALDETNLVVRTVSDFETLKRFFGLGVSFIDSVVNRHRIELFVLDVTGQIAGIFQRLHWDVSQVVQSAAKELSSHSDAVPIRKTPSNFSSLAFSTLASILIAFFPKCPFCWAAYMTAFGIAGLEQIPFIPWLREIFIVMMMVNLVCLWFRARATQRIPAFIIAVTGMSILLVFRVLLDWQSSAWIGIGITLVGVLWCAMPRNKLGDIYKQKADRVKAHFPVETTR